MRRVIILPIENIRERVNRVHNSHNEAIAKTIRALRYYARRHNLNIKLIVDGGGQGIGKTTHWIRESINNVWITIVFVLSHYKAIEILKDLEPFPDTLRKKIKPELKYNLFSNTLRVHTLYSRYWTLDKNDWYVSPQYENMKCLCVLYRENPVIFKMLKDRHLNNYCRQDDPENTNRCKYRYECKYNNQLSDIINQIKGSKWQLISNVIRHPDRNIIEKRRDDIIDVQNRLLKFLKNMKPVYLEPLEGIIKKKGNQILVRYVKNKYPNRLKNYDKTGKHAIWRGKLTKSFILWVNKRIKINNIKKRELAKEERKKIHHVIILPHIYLFLSTIDKISNTFDNEIDAIIDENNIDLIYEPIKITRGRAYEEIKFFNDNKRELKDRGVNLDVYEQFKPIIDLLNNRLKYTDHEEAIIERLKRNISNAPYNSRAQELERQRLESYRNELDNNRSLLISNKLVAFAEIFDETKYQIDYTNYINGILNYNKENIRHRKPPIQITDNLFSTISKMLSELNSVIENNTSEINTGIDVYLREKSLNFKINRMASLNNLIESVKKYIVFADATAKYDIYKKYLGQENKFYFMRYDDISNYDKYYGYPSNGKLNAKYQLWDNDEKRFTNDSYNLIDRVAWLIKLEKIEKIYITLYGEFNDGKRKDDNILDGKFMIILGAKLRIKYNMDIKGLDIKLCFRYTDSGKDLFKDRTVEIQFGCAGITARGTKRLMTDHDLSKSQVDYIKIDGEQEQSAGRCRGFKHQSPVRHYLLTSRISPKFRNVKNINIALKYMEVIDYIEVHGDLTTRQIKEQLHITGTLSNLNATLIKIANADIGLRYRFTRANLRIWYYKKIMITSTP